MNDLAVRSIVVVLMLATPIGAAGQQPARAAAAAPAGATVTHQTPAESYVIGTGDVLSVTFWRDKDMSADVTVRPDGKISLPLLNDMQAAGRTPEELRGALVEAASKYLEEPNATVVVREIHSRNVFITGNVLKPGPYSLTTDMNVLQLIASAGGLQEYADAGGIVVIRSENGRQQYLPFNYKDVVKQKNTQQNIVLKPGDTIVVP